MISRAEWLRKYALYEGCRNKPCECICEKCEFKESTEVYECDLIKEAAEIFENQVLLTKALFDNNNNN